jgi:putative inorganic carbon (hco3(-)) transporter
MAIMISFVVVSVANNSQKVSKLITGLCLGGAIISIYGLTQYIQGQYGRFHYLFSPFYSEVFYSRGRGISIVATFANPNILACFAAPLLSLAIGKLVTSKWKTVTLWFCVVLFLMCALTFTYSKNAWLQMGIIVLLWTVFLLRPHTQIILLLSIALVALVYFSRAEGPLAQFQSLFPRDYEISVAPRIELWTIALQVIAARPFSGYGLDGFAAATLEVRTDLFTDLTRTHNLYLQMLADIGVVGFVLLYGLVIYIWILGVRAYMYTRSSNARNTLFSLLIANVSLLVGSLFETPVSSNAYVSLTWIILGLTFAAARHELQPAMSVAAARGHSPQPVGV